MKNKLVGYLKTIFERREWDPNTISGLGDWKLGATEYSSDITHTWNPRGIPHPHLPLSERLKKVEADLDAFEKCLPDLNSPQS